MSEPFFFKPPLETEWFFREGHRLCGRQHKMAIINNMHFFAGYENKFTHTIIYRGCEYFEYVVVYIGVTYDTNDVFVILADRSDYKNNLVLPVHKFRGHYTGAVFASQKEAETFLLHAFTAYHKKDQSGPKYYSLDDLQKLSDKYNQNIPGWEGPIVIRYTVLKNCKKRNVEITISANVTDTMDVKELWLAKGRAQTLSVLQETCKTKIKEAVCFLICAKRMGLYKDVAKLIVNFILK